MQNCKKYYFGKYEKGIRISFLILVTRKPTVYTSRQAEPRKGLSQEENQHLSTSVLRECGTEAEESTPRDLQKFLEGQTFFKFWKGWEAGQRGNAEAPKHDASNDPM